MALYTSTQDGNWSDAATWGGGGTPSINGDQASIGHDVTYDLGDSVIEFNDITITNGGILIFPTASDSTIKFDATAVFTIESGGELRAGTSSTPINSANHCYFNWPQGAAIRSVFVVNNGGIVNIYGDPAFYGSTKYATLGSAWDANASLTLYVEGDISSYWQSGQKFCISKNVLYANYTTDTEIFEIQSVGVYDSSNNRTPITVTNKGAGATFADEAPLVMLSRNIELCDPGASWAINGYNAYDERIRMQINQTSSNNLINVSDSIFRGWYGIYNGYNFIGNNIVFLNNDASFYYYNGFTGSFDSISNNYGLYSVTFFNVTGKSIANQSGVYASIDATVIGDFISNNYGITAGRNHSVIGNFLGNNYGIYTTGRGDYKVEGNFNNNNIALYGAKISQVIGDFNSNTTAITDCVGVRIFGDFVSNGTDFENSCKEVIVQTGDFPTGLNLFMDYANVKRSVILEDCRVNGVRRALRIYENSGSFFPLVNTDGDWVSPPSEENWILKAIPNSYCDSSFVRQMEISPMGYMRQYLNSGSNIIRAKVYPVGWTTSLNQDDVYIEAWYLDGLNVARARAVTGVSIFPNGIWSEVIVSFNAGQTGIVYFNLYVTKYEAGCYILIDPVFLFE